MASARTACTAVEREEAKARGVYRGRKPSINLAEMQRLHTEERFGASAMARHLGIGRASVYRALARRGGAS